MNKVKLAGLAMALPILALSGPAFAQSVPNSNLALPTAAPGALITPLRTSTQVSASPGSLPSSASAASTAATSANWGTIESV